jgi:hypothetical protein
VEREQDRPLRCLQSQVLRTAATLLLIAEFASCSRPSLKPRILDGPLPTAELIRSADVIVVGTMTSLILGKPIHTNIPNLNDCLVPAWVNVSVENVLRGSVPTSLEFEYFGSNCGTSGPVESPQLGSRSVFFLRRDSEVWRSLADYWMNRIPVYTGRHAHEFLVGKPIEQAISEILLTPGAESTTVGLIEALTLSAPMSSSLIGPVAVEQLLKPYLSHPDMGARVRACGELNGFGDSSEDCASRLVGENLDLIAKRGFGAIPPSLVLDLEQLSNYAESNTRGRFRTVLPFLKDAGMAPPVPAPLVPPALR